MKFKHVQIIHMQLMPFPDWFLRWSPWVASGVACAGYLSGILSTQHLTLLSLFLLTGTYGAWLVIYQIGLRRLKIQIVLTLFCLSLRLPVYPLAWHKRLLALAATGPHD